MKHIIIRGLNGVGAWYPADPVRGRFTLRGRIAEGYKNVIDKPVEVQLTREQAERLRKDLTEALERHPHCGTEVEPEEED